MAAQQHPDLLFIGVEQPQKTAIKNLAGLIFHEEQSGFLAGALAAMVTRTQHVAAVCESRFLDPIRRYCEGFHAGANYLEPSVSVSVVYRAGSPENVYQDMAWGQTEALSQVQNGADVVFAAGGDTAVAALEAAAAQHVQVIGTESDLFPESVTLQPELLTCAVNDVRAGVLDLLQRARNGQFPAGDFFGQTGLSPFHDLENTIPVSVRDRILQLEQALDNGSLQLDIPYDNPLD